jgi:hypothetical protein
MLNLIVLEKDSSFKKSEIIIADFDLLCNYLYELPNTKARYFSRGLTFELPNQNLQVNQNFTRYVFFSV